MTELNGAVVESSHMTTGIIKICMNLGLHHLFAACRLSARVKEIETENINQPFGAFWEEILQNSLGVAMLTVAALESYANEMYFEGAILNSSVNAVAADELAELIDREQILKKYSVALSFAAGKKLDYGISVTQSTQALIKLRNAVVHFRPEWSGEQNQHKKLSSQLCQYFQPSRFFLNESIFPRAWASHSFTEWALETVVQFIEYFHHEVGVPSGFAQFEKQLSDLSGGSFKAFHK